MSDREITIEHPLAKGTVVPAGDLWEFPDGLIGLADYRSFALLPLSGAEPFRLLCSADDPSFGLVLVDPCVFVPGYELSLTPDDLKPLPADDAAKLEVLVPVVLPSENSPLCINLRGPLVFCPHKRCGIQRVSGDEAHSIRHEPDLSHLVDPARSCSS